MSQTVRTALVALFVTALVTAQLAAAKVLAVPLPADLPLVGATVFVPGGVLAYALTFFASDCYAEIYGRREAQVLVNVGFAMNFVLLGLVYFALWMPIAPPGITGASQAQFGAVVESGTAVVAGSLLAYLVSQNWDVLVFHWIRDRTGRAHLWLRNLASTGTSQAIDTVIFVGVAFAVGPAVLSGTSLPPVEQLAALMVGQYLAKLAIAVLDTPFVYGVVSVVGARDAGADATAWAR
ncbi:MAG: queuosine precursor transporter [Haloarculaceae archaeon]